MNSLLYSCSPGTVITITGGYDKNNKVRVFGKGSYLTNWKNRDFVAELQANHMANTGKLEAISRERALGNKVKVLDPVLEQLHNLYLAVPRNRRTYFLSMVIAKIVDG